MCRGERRAREGPEQKAERWALVARALGEVGDGDEHHLHGLDLVVDHPVDVVDVGPEAVGGQDPSTGKW